MTLEAWLPIGHKLPDGAKSRVALYEGQGWQILETQGNGRALVTRDELAQRWQTGIMPVRRAVTNWALHTAEGWRLQLAK